MFSSAFAKEEVAEAKAEAKQEELTKIKVGGLSHDGTNSPVSKKPKMKLSERRAEVKRLWDMGVTDDAEIAKRIGANVNTIGNDRSAILTKRKRCRNFGARCTHLFVFIGPFVINLRQICLKFFLATRVFFRHALGAANMLRSRSYQMILRSTAQDTLRLQGDNVVVLR